MIQVGGWFGWFGVLWFNLLVCGLLGCCMVFVVCGFRLFCVGVCCEFDGLFCLLMRCLVVVT